MDIGRLERAYILEQSSNKEYRIPQPILDELSHELWKTVDTSETISLFLSDTDVYNDKKIWILILNSYQSWAQEVRRQYCELAWIDDFDTFLRNQVDTVSNLELRDPIQKSFEYAIWRSLREDEFFPTILGIELLYRRIGDMKVEWIKDRAKKKFEKLMWKIERATLLFHK